MEQQINAKLSMPSVFKTKLDNTIQKYLDIEGVENININRPEQVFYEISGGHRTKVDDPNLTLKRLQDLAAIIASYNGIDWKPDQETLSAKLPDGTRVEVFQTKAVVSGFSMSLRKRKSNAFAMDNFGIIQEDQDKIIKAIRSRKNILLSGGTSTGKTSLLEIFASYIEPERRLLTIQDPVEISFTQENRIDFTVTSTDFEKRGKELIDICNSAMRQNPDSIIFGEIREKYMAHTYRTASNTGHEGCMATIHANDPQAALERLVNLVHGLEGGDKSAIMHEVMKCINIVIQLRKKPDGKRTAEIKYIT